jgi:hypothetical protein
MKASSSSAKWARLLFALGRFHQHQIVPTRAGDVGAEDAEHAVPEPSSAGEKPS